MSRDQAQQGRAPAAAERGGATTHEGDDLAKGQAAVQILEGGGLFPRITSWAASAIEQANYVGAAEASRRWFTNRPYLRTLARSFDAGDPTVKQAQALIDDMEPFEDRLPTVLELTFAGSAQGKAAWLARIGRAPKAEPADANEPAATAVPAVQSPLRPENVKSGWDYVTGAALGGVAILHGEAHRGGTDPLADMINNAVDSSAYAKGFAVGGVEGAWDALKDNARIFDDINDLIVDLVKAKVAGGDIGVLLAVRDKIMGLIAAGKQVPAALKAFAERWNDASDLAAQGHFQGHAVGYIAVQVLALVIGAIAPGGQYADVIRILKLATDPLGGLLELGTAAKAARAAKTAGKVESAVEGAAAGERAGVQAAEGAAAGEGTLGGVFEEAGSAGGRPRGEPARPGATPRAGGPSAAGEGAADASSGAAMRFGDESAAQEMGRASPGPEGIAKPLSRSEALLEGLPTDLRGRVRIIESPVLTDSTVRVSYRDGIVLVVGAEATPRHIAYHASTVRVLLRFEGLAGEIRKLIDKVLTHLRVRAGYGTRGFEAELEVQKLTGMRDDLQRLLARADDRLHGGDALDPDLLRAELASVEAQLAEHRTKLGDYADGVGHVEARGIPATRVQTTDLFAEELVDEHAMILWLNVVTPEGKVRKWGDITIPLKDGRPQGGPVLNIDASLYGDSQVTKMEIFAGDVRVSATDYALNQATTFYKRRFGVEPESFEGHLGAENKLNFQREWYRLTSAGMGSDEAAKRAAGAISFGRHRASRGYDEFHVDFLGLPEEVDLGPPYGMREVPTGIRITARKQRGDK
ncbi:MAG: hypothetical protein IPH44_18780 [Myxococcales bacterium]|nr:hypothetical protein [Myxococcales bacterium]MBK7197269.1 hypothetical protein [Myxococcales bacterium]MBP6845447.1 hypothetical protein [Kofleriaceae bacterium]